MDMGEISRKMARAMHASSSTVGTEQPCTVVSPCVLFWYVRPLCYSLSEQTIDPELQKSATYTGDRNTAQRLEYHVFKTLFELRWVVDLQ